MMPNMQILRNSNYDVNSRTYVKKDQHNIPRRKYSWLYPNRNI